MGLFIQNNEEVIKLREEIEQLKEKMNRSKWQRLKAVFKK